MTWYIHVHSNVFLVYIGTFECRSTVNVPRALAITASHTPDIRPQVTGVQEENQPTHCEETAHHHASYTTRQGALVRLRQGGCPERGILICLHNTKFGGGRS